MIVGAGEEAKPATWNLSFVFGGMRRSAMIIPRVLFPIDFRDANDSETIS